MKIVRYALFLLCLALAAAGCGQTPQTADTPKQPEPKAEALNPSLAAHNIYAMALYADDTLITEYYKDGYNQDSLFPVFSCTKSITSILIGMAIDEGTIKSPDQLVAELLPNRGITPGIAGKGQLRLRHLLNQTSGFDWPEWSNNQIINKLSLSKDWVQFVLDRPLANKPGQTFNYNSGNSHLLSAILQEATGQSTLAYAKARLFEPLGITNMEWTHDPSNIYCGGFGISMTVRDMAKIGLLYLHHGAWQNKQLVSKKWVQESLTKQSEGWKPLGSYGYQWWIRPAHDTVKYDVYFASGLGGQYIFIIPDLNAVAAFTSWLSNEESAKPIECLEQLIIPMLEKRKPSV